jgi:hypothetical protein
MTGRMFDADSTAKLKRLIEEGMQVKQEVSDLREDMDICSNVFGWFYFRNS